MLKPSTRDHGMINPKDLFGISAYHDVKYAAMIHAAYLLIHFPNPLVLNEELILKYVI
jgi:hypothetical protein